MFKPVQEQLREYWMDFRIDPLAPPEEIPNMLKLLKDPFSSCWRSRHELSMIADKRVEDRNADEDLTIPSSISPESAGRNRSFETDDALTHTTLVHNDDGSICKKSPGRKPTRRKQYPARGTPGPKSTVVSVPCAPFEFFCENLDDNSIRDPSGIS